MAQLGGGGGGDRGHCSDGCSPELCVGDGESLAGSHGCCCCPQSAWRGYGDKNPLRSVRPPSFSRRSRTWPILPSASLHQSRRTHGLDNCFLHGRPLMPVGEREEVRHPSRSALAANPLRSAAGGQSVEISSWRATCRDRPPAHRLGKGKIGSTVVLRPARRLGKGTTGKPCAAVGSGERDGGSPVCRPPPPPPP
jgi:hypothetical protein